jgi:glycosyltransferase involved in cell wall biosynthesis
VIGTLARLSPDKKLEQLVSAIAHASPRLAGCEVRIAGGVERGSERYAEELRASSRGLPIVWCGEQDSASLLAACDFFAMVSEPSGCPNASIEAMAGGLAVVATDAGGVREQVVHGKTGLLVPRGDVSALGDAIAELAADPARRTSMGHAGHARARDLYDVHRMARDYARICLGRDLEGRAAAE